MQYGIEEKMFLRIYSSLIKDGVTKEEMKNIKKEYRAILERAKDIGKGNTLEGSYVLAALFIAFKRNTDKTAEECYQILHDGIENSRLMHMVAGTPDGYLSEKRMKKRREWEKETHERKYENDWVVNVLGPTDTYDLGYDYLECGVVKLCRDEGVPELAKHLCALDFLISSMIGLKLERTGTLAEGADKCDFRFSRK